MGDNIILEGNIIKLCQDYKGYRNDNDVFIICSSFEERSKALIDLFDKDILFENSIIVNYDESTKTNLRDYNYIYIKKQLNKISNKVHTILCDRHDPLDFLSKLKYIVDKKLINVKGNLLLDITTFTKQYTLILLKYVDNLTFKSIKICYTEPLYYSKNTPLSYGRIGINAVPSYGGHYDRTKEKLLMLLLGYEGDRAYGIWERITPNKTIAYIGKPAYSNGIISKVERFNQKLIKKLPKNSIKFLPALDPFEANKRLKKDISCYINEYNISICPLGPKPQIIGLYNALKIYNDVQVIYASPKYYEEQYFSKKIGNIWEFS